MPHPHLKQNSLWAVKVHSDAAELQLPTLLARHEGVVLQKYYMEFSESLFFAGYSKHSIYIISVTLKQIHNIDHCYISHTTRVKARTKELIV